MNAVEAMIYCLGWIDTVPDEDGYFQSRIVYDRSGEPHWFAIHERSRTPGMCSEAAAAFSGFLEPYRMTK